MYEPRIDDIPISGTDRTSQPVLKISGQPNALGQSWICVEVEPGLDEAGERLRSTLGEKSRVEIVHTTEPVSKDPVIGRQALAILLWRDGAPFSVQQIVHFNLRYLRITSSSETDQARHLFY